jgi:hypothetical protein
MYREKFKLEMDPELMKTIEESKLNFEVFKIYDSHFKRLNEESKLPGAITKC